MSTAALHSRSEVPLGTIRVRRHNGRQKVRMIKIRMDGPTGLRWINYARWWWEQNRGPVPPGKRVCHLDGDSLNDDPANYGLLTPGDVAFLAHDRDPAMSRRNYAKCRKATADANRLRAITRRLREWLPSKWYAVDLSSRKIINIPHRKRVHVFRAHGIDDAKAPNGKGIESAALGWGGLSTIQACILAVLAGEAWIESLDLRQRVAQFRSLRCWGGDVTTGAFHSAISGLRKCEFVLTQRRGSLQSRYHIAAAAIAARTQICPVVPIRGDDLDDERFAGFQRFTPGFSPDQTDEALCSDSSRAMSIESNSDQTEEDEELVSMLLE